MEHSPPRKQDEDFGLTRVSNWQLEDSLDRRSRFLFRSTESKSDWIPEIDVPPYVTALPVAVPWCHWRKNWSYIRSAFFAEAECLRREATQNPTRFEPESPSHWWKTVNNEFPKSIGSDIRWTLSAHYLVHQDIGAWAYACTILEFCFRNPWFNEERFLQDDIPHRAYRILVRRFYDFAQSRRDYHFQILTRLSDGYTSSGDHIDAKVTGKRKVRGKNVFGRPKDLFGPNETKKLWLILIWPIACRYRWTYADVLRAQRLFFGEGRTETEPYPVHTLQARDFGSKKRVFRMGLSEEALEWYEEQLNVVNGDKNLIQKTCHSLGLTLPERSKSQPRLRIPAEPKMMMFIFHLPRRTSFGPYHLWNWIGKLDLKHSEILNELFQDLSDPLK